MTDDEIAEIIERDLSGTSGMSASHSRIAEDNDLNLDRVMRVSSEIGVEECYQCGWWTFRDEATHTEGGEIMCNDCVEDDDE